jgi:quercetin dioxygenase-like cupin family protein
MEELPSFSPAEGVRMHPLFGEAGMLNWIDLEPGAGVPLHSHPHEQLGFVVRGEIEMRVAGETYICGVGHGYAIPGGVEHEGFAGPEGCLVVDVFVPVREDLREALARGA